MTVRGKDGEGENIFSYRSVEVGHGFAADFKLFQLRQEGESLAGFTEFESGVKGP